MNEINKFIDQDESEADDLGNIYMVNLVRFLITFPKALWVYCWFGYKFSLMNLSRSLYLTVSDLEEQVDNPVEEQSNSDVLVKENAELNRI